MRPLVTFDLVSIHLPYSDLVPYLTLSVFSPFLQCPLCAIPLLQWATLHPSSKNIRLLWKSVQKCGWHYGNRPYLDRNLMGREWGSYFSHLINVAFTSLKNSLLVAQKRQGINGFHGDNRPLLSAHAYQSQERPAPSPVVRKSVLPYWSAISHQINSDRIYKGEGIPSSVLCKQLCTLYRKGTRSVLVKLNSISPIQTFGQLR